MHNTQSSLQSVTKTFLGLAEVSGNLPAGDYRAEMTGPGWLRISSRPALACIGFKRWYGKRIAQDGQAINLKDNAGQLTECLPMMLQIEPSRIDGRRCWVLRYPASTHFPVRHMVDELRPLNENTMLGMSYTELPGLRRLGLPFLLHRQN